MSAERSNNHFYRHCRPPSDTPDLNSAAYHGNSAKVWEYLMEGANINEVNAGGYTAIASAVSQLRSRVGRMDPTLREGYISTICMLVSNNCNLEQHVPGARWAITDTLEELIHSPNLSDREKERLRCAMDVRQYKTDAEKNTAVVSAAAAGNLEMIEALCSSGANMGATNAEGYSAVYCATLALQQKLSSCEWAIYNDADRYVGIIECCILENVVLEESAANTLIGWLQGGYLDPAIHNKLRNALRKNSIYGGVVTIETSDAILPASPPPYSALVQGVAATAAQSAPTPLPTYAFTVFPAMPASGVANGAAAVDATSVNPIQQFQLQLSDVQKNYGNRFSYDPYRSVDKWKNYLRAVEAAQAAQNVVTR